MTIDPKCAELAQHFLEENEETVAISSTRYQNELAQEIQTCIENWIERTLDNFEPRETGDAWTGGFAKNH